MPTKFYGYAENGADVEVLQAYAGIDIQCAGGQPQAEDVTVDVLSAGQTLLPG